MPKTKLEFFLKHVPSFLDYLSVEKGLSKNSLEAYKRDLESFGRFLLESSLDTKDVTREELIDYLMSRRTAGASPRSVARATSAIRGLFKFLAAEKTLPRDPTDDLENPKKWSTLPKLLSVVEIQRLLEAPDVSTSKGLRRGITVRGASLA